ncbi:Gfo/Idh/MocA family oxidoreductase [Lachnospiraceae bacterium 56-18]
MRQNSSKCDYIIRKVYTEDIHHEKSKGRYCRSWEIRKVHARNLAFKIPNAELTAACSIVPAELEYAREELGVTDVYEDYREMLARADIDAVAIVTTSGEHCWQIAAALDAGKHVFTDKPLGVTVEECRLAEAAVERHPESVFFLGFMRRYDPSYAYAKKKIEEGVIGTPYMVKAAGIDLLEMQEFVDCVADGKKPEVTVYDGTKSTQIGFATTQAWKTGSIVKIEYN